MSVANAPGVIARVDKPSFKAAHNVALTPQGVTSPFARFEPPGRTTSAPDSAADRILLTLLALSLMLLAFFVVLTSSASFDQRRMREVVHSVQKTFVPPQKSGEETQDVPADAALATAVGALRVAVSDIFSGLLPRDPVLASSGKKRPDPDRVEIDVPMAVFFADKEAVLFPLPVLDKIVAVLSAPPAGYRMELVVRAAGKTADPALEQARVAALADGLVHRGLAATALSVGTLQNTPETGARSLRFTFLLLNADDDLAAARILTGGTAQ